MFTPEPRQARPGVSGTAEHRGPAPALPPPSRLLGCAAPADLSPPRAVRPGAACDYGVLYCFPPFRATGNVFGSKSGDSPVLKN